MRRRDFLRQTTLAAGAGFLAACGQEGKADMEAGYADVQASSATGPLFRVSLAQWSFHRAIQSGEMDPLDFAAAAKSLDIAGIEYVNGLFTDRRTDDDYLRELGTRADGEGVRSVLIMCDGEGALGAPDEAARTLTIENHRRWIDAAAFLGCHSIRVNASSQGDWDTQRDLAADGLRRLTEVAAAQDINVIVENHGGISSNGAWLAEVMRLVDHDRCGTLPDFGNWDLGDGNQYDFYKGTEELMPFAKAVSFKTHILADQPDGTHYRTDWAGNRTPIDFDRLMRIVLDAGYRGYVGIEFEGSELDEMTGIRRSKVILDHLHDKLQSDYS
jgi:L-ribulose-5-phosphate 3-epimerase